MREHRGDVTMGGISDDYAIRIEASPMREVMIEAAEHARRRADEGPPSWRDKMRTFLRGGK